MFWDRSRKVIFSLYCSKLKLKNFTTILLFSPRVNQMEYPVV